MVVRGVAGASRNEPLRNGAATRNATRSRLAARHSCNPRFTTPTGLGEFIVNGVGVITQIAVKPFSAVYKTITNNTRL